MMSEFRGGGGGDRGALRGGPRAVRDGARGDLEPHRRDEPRDDGGAIVRKTKMFLERATTRRTRRRLRPLGATAKALFSETRPRDLTGALTGERIAAAVPKVMRRVRARFPGGRRERRARVYPQNRRVRAASTCLFRARFVRSRRETPLAHQGPRAPASRRRASPPALAEPRRALGDTANASPGVDGLNTENSRSQFRSTRNARAARRARSETDGRRPPSPHLTPAVSSIAPAGPSPTPVWRSSRLSVTPSRRRGPSAQSFRMHPRGGGGSTRARGSPVRAARSRVERSSR